jgi:UDP-N-acetylmuramate dehydrogenase
MSVAAAFPEITKTREPLAPHTHLRIGGPAEFFVRPRAVTELAAVLTYCASHQVPLRMLGGGHNLLVRDDPVQGVVLKLDGPAFAFLETTGRTVRAGGGTVLYDLIAHAVAGGLAGLETLVGIRGTVGGSVRVNVGDKSGEIGSSVRRVAVLTDEAKEQVRTRDQLTFGDHSSDLDEPVILWVEFELESDRPEAILKRMTRAWVMRKATEPFSFQASVRMFRDPPGHTAASLIDKAGLARTKVGGAEVNDRNPNYVVAHPGTTAADIIAVMARVREKVSATAGVDLDRELHVW